MSFRSHDCWRQAIVALLLGFAVGTFALTSPHASAPSPPAENDLICHTDNPADCYPRIFSPTKDFQTVHDDQDLPLGLHVRLNLQTGQKEARLNVPTEDESVVEHLPVDQAVVVVEPEAAEQARIPQGAPTYEAVGKVKEPLEKDAGFPVAMQTLKEQAEAASPSSSNALDGALAELEEVSHDIYYGKQIMADDEALKSLFCLVTSGTNGDVATSGSTERQDLLASRILSSSLQNNPSALRNVETNWDSLMNKQCVAHQQPLRTVFLPSLRPAAEPGTQAFLDEAYRIRISLPVMGRLLKSDSLQSEFIRRDGMKSFLKILLTQGPDWAAPRKKVAQIVSDVFLDEDVGAQVGVWPTGPASDKTICAANNGANLDDGCWEYHLEKITARGDDDSVWSRELSDLLRQRRPDLDHARNEL